MTLPMLIAFDCLHARGRDLTREPLWERRAVLERELSAAGRHVAIVRRLDANGLEAWRQVVAHGWEGVMTPGAPTRRWVKVKQRVAGWPWGGV